MLKLFSKISFLAIALVLFCPNAAKSQVTPDSTLGTENSRVNSINELRDRIEGGAIRGKNLFHSFEEFNVREGAEVYFANPEEISNIFSRITGSNISEIFGTLGVEGAANLFLINPNGIIFGKNVFIDVGGSFIATTAEKVRFENGEVFNARDREQPILTWNAPIGLGLEKPGNIEVRGTNNNVLVEVPSFKINTGNETSGIITKPNQNITLIGGGITFNGGGIITEGGTIQIGSVGDNQNVDLIPTETSWKATYEEVTQFKDISLQNGSLIDASGDTAGAISLNGRQIFIDNSSVIMSNTIVSSSNSLNSISIDASESLELSGNLDLNNNSLSLIGADVMSNATGDGIDIKINTTTLKLIDGAEIRAVNFSDSKNQTGQINIDAQQIEVSGIKPGNIETTDGTSAEGGLNSLITTSVGINSQGGSANDINIETESLTVSYGGSIKADTFGSGSAGNLKITAEDVKLIGINEFFPSRSTGLLTSVSPNSEINNASSNIFLTAKTLQIINGARIKTAREGFDDTSAAGSINITANNIDLIGYSRTNPSIVSGIFTSVGINSLGNGGNITVEADKLNVLDGARIQADSSGVGKSGNIEITAQEINLNGTREEVGLFVAGITTSSVGSRSEKGGGNIILVSDRLKISDGSQINAISRGLGNGGNIRVRAGEIKIDRVDPTKGRISGFYADSQKLSGSGGNINIASDRIFSNGGVFSASSEEGDGGNIIVNSEHIDFLNNSLISAEAGGGSGGNINIQSDRITTNNSDITAASSSQRGGNLTLIGERFIFQDSILNASAANEGDGGNVTINADTVLGINSDITATAEFGDGGNVIIDADGVLGFTEASAIEDNGISEVDITSQFGTDGTITITNPLNTSNDPLVLLVTAPQRNNDLPLRTDCDNDAGNGEAYLTDSTHPNIPDSPETYLDEDVITEEPVVEEPLPPSSSVIEELLWKPGKPYAVADVQIQTPDGRIFAVNREQLMKMQQRGCVDVEAIKN
jgi:filamentous hemagglutinin family protein